MAPNSRCWTNPILGMLCSSLQKVSDYEASALAAESGVEEQPCHGW